MLEDKDSTQDRREDIEERLRLMTEAERKTWITHVQREDRLRQKRERAHRRFLALIGTHEPSDTVDHAQEVGQMFKRYQAVVRARPSSKPSRLLNPDLAALDEQE